MEWYWIVLAVLVLVILAFPIGLHLYILRYYIQIIGRIFQEKPLFILPFGQPHPDAEEVTLTTPDGMSLLGCYIKTKQPRKGVLLFGLEFGSNRWSCVPYCEFLIGAGYDVFAFETRGQGKSTVQSGYEPLQWVTEFEVIDFQTALAYLKSRPDRDPRGIGLFGLSKGGSAGLTVAAKDPFIRCAAVDGIFAALTTMVPYMKQWIFIYSDVKWLARILPTWYLRFLAVITIRQVGKERDCHYPRLEPCMAMFAPRPLLMIHGGGDTYIKPEMAKALFDLAGEPKEFWLVEKAKHNQAFHLANEEYKRRVLEFFDKHLASSNPVANGTVIGKPHSADRPMIMANLV